jgi:hypothetical protein
MKIGDFTARSAEYWSRRAWDRKLETDDTITTGPASDVRRIDPASGEVIENIKSEEQACAKGRYRLRRR